MKMIFEKWFFKDLFTVSLRNYKESWSKNGTGKRYKAWTNGGSIFKGECFDFNADFGYFAFSFTIWRL